MRSGSRTEEGSVRVFSPSVFSLFKSKSGLCSSLARFICADVNRQTSILRPFGGSGLRAVLNQLQNGLLME